MERMGLLVLLSQNQYIARVKANGFLYEGKTADAACSYFAAASPERQFGATEDIGALLAGTDTGVIDFVDHCQIPFFPAAVCDADSIAGARQP
jgi:hypothetical protein